MCMSCVYCINLFVYVCEQDLLDEHTTLAIDNVDTVKLLVEYGAKVDATTIDNRTVLHIACGVCCVQCFVVVWG